MHHDQLGDRHRDASPMVLLQGRLYLMQSTINTKPPASSPVMSPSATESSLTLGHALLRVACVWGLRGRHKDPAIAAQHRVQAMAGALEPRAPQSWATCRVTPQRK